MGLAALCQRCLRTWSLPQAACGKHGSHSFFHETPSAASSGWPHFRSCCVRSHREQVLCRSVCAAQHAAPAAGLCASWAHAGLTGLARTSPAEPWAGLFLFLPFCG